MNRRTTITLTALLLAPLAGLSAADGLVVYPPVPRLAASEHYKVRVRPASDGSTAAPGRAPSLATREAMRQAASAFAHDPGEVQTTRC